MESKLSVIMFNASCLVGGPTTLNSGEDCVEDATLPLSRIPPLPANNTIGQDQMCFGEFTSCAVLAVTVQR